MSEMLYLQTERNIKITSPVVTLGDVAQLSCSDGAVLARNQVRRIRVRKTPGSAGAKRFWSASLRLSELRFPL